MRRTSILLVCTLLLGGCAAFAPKLEAPAVELIAIDLAEAQLRRQRFNVVIRLTNPNDRAIPIEALDYRIRLAGQDFARGRSIRQFTLPARGEADLEAEISTDLVKSLFQMLRWLEQEQETLDYEIAGSIDTGRWFGGLPFSKRGKVPVR